MLIEKGAFGGMITNAEHVENFPGFPQGISGIELGDRMREQAEKYNLKIASTEATAIELRGKQKVITTLDEKLTASALILAGGSMRKKLGVPGEEKYVGKGVSYCATCDSAFFKDMPVVVVGGGDASLTEALHLARHTSQVTVIHRRAELRATRILRERAMAEPKIRFIWNSVVREITGDGIVNAIVLSNVQTGKTSRLETAGVFVSIGFHRHGDGKGNSSARRNRAHHYQREYGNTATGRAGGRRYSAQFGAAGNHRRRRWRHRCHQRTEIPG